MSIQSEITRISGNIADAYTAAGEKGATMPQDENSDNLPATIRSINGDSFTVDSTTAPSALSVSAGGFATASFSIAKSGYTPLGIVGITKSGTQYTTSVLLAYYISSSTAYVTWRNTATSTGASLTTTVYVLYKKN
jgi:hypothetical protein